jgi:DNA-binding CsgD family transcriptional regulator
MNNPASARTTTRSQALAEGHRGFGERSWSKAFSELSLADRESPLDPEDLLLLAQSAQLIGKDAEAADILARAHQAWLTRDEFELAAGCAIRLGFSLLIRGDAAQGSGWISRAARLLEGRPECVQHGYLLLTAGYRSFHGGDPINAQAVFAQIISIGQRFGDKDLLALCLQGQGRSLIRQGDLARGLALLDEAMVSVTSGEVSPINAGGVYCSVLDGCGEIYDLRRAQEWTAALERWCAAQPDLVPFRGHCLIRRAELLQLHGDWPESLDWARKAVEWLSNPVRPGLGLALYQAAEIHRLRGDFAAAGDSYREASQILRSPGPGFALLRLAQGRVDTAASGVRSMLEETQEAGPRSRILDAAVEIFLAANEFDAAHDAASELSRIAAERELPFFQGLAAQNVGAILLAENDNSAALAELRHACAIWRDLETPYEAARVRILMALASRKLGDEDQAVVDLTAARDAFQQLGALPDRAQAERLLANHPRRAAGPLTERELQVLRLVASGATNRAIATRLHISEKTVARHLSNIFTKLDLTSRTAAAAYAYDHNIV